MPPTRLIFTSSQMTTFKFFKHKNGNSSFAAITLELMEGATGIVGWAEALASHEAAYGEAVRLGIKGALKWHGDGGDSASFRVVDFAELVVDTKPDAARCAATGAAWKALGHDEDRICFELDGQWRAKLI